MDLHHLIFESDHFLPNIVHFIHWKSANTGGFCVNVYPFPNPCYHATTMVPRAQNRVPAPRRWHHAAQRDRPSSYRGVGWLLIDQVTAHRLRLLVIPPRFFIPIWWFPWFILCFPLFSKVNKYCEHDLTEFSTFVPGCAQKCRVFFPYMYTCSNLKPSNKLSIRQHPLMWHPKQGGT